MPDVSTIGTYDTPVARGNLLGVGVQLLGVGRIVYLGAWGLLFIPAHLACIFNCLLLRFGILVLRYLLSSDLAKA